MFDKTTFRLKVALAATVIGCLNAPSFAAEYFDATLLSFAVNIDQTPLQTWGPGYGIYLGNGLFVTAAHVAGFTLLTRPKVTIAGKEYPTTVVKEGNLNQVDLTFLSVDETLLPMRIALRHNVLCPFAPSPGEEVVTVVPEKIVRTQIFPPAKLPPSLRKFSTVIADVANTGNSGSGVFDAPRRCLLGIMSRKLTQVTRQRESGKITSRDIAKYFVPASTIEAFMPPGNGFR